MSAQPLHPTPSRHAVVLAAGASCFVVCASVAGVLTTPVVVATLAVAAVIAVISHHHSRPHPSGDLLVPLRVAPATPVRIVGARAGAQRSTSVIVHRPDAA